MSVTAEFKSGSYCCRLSVTGTTALGFAAAHVTSVMQRRSLIHPGLRLSKSFDNPRGKRPETSKRGGINDPIADRWTPVLFRVALETCKPVSSGFVFKLLMVISWLQVRACCCGSTQTVFVAVTRVAFVNVAAPFVPVVCRPRVPLVGKSS